MGTLKSRVGEALLQKQPHRLVWTFPSSLSCVLSIGFPVWPQVCLAACPHPSGAAEAEKLYRIWHGPQQCHINTVYTAPAAALRQPGPGVPALHGSATTLGWGRCPQQLGYRGCRSFVALWSAGAHSLRGWHDTTRLQCCLFSTSQFLRTSPHCGLSTTTRVCAVFCSRCTSVSIDNSL